MICTLTRKISVLVVSGLLIAVIGLVMYCTFPIFMENEIKKRLVLKEGSQSYSYWKDVPVPIYIHFYFFNITNPEEIWALTNKPVLEELGPYTFRESREKVNITWNENGTVSYRQIRRWYYQYDKTNGTLDDVVTTLNVPMVAAAMRGKQMNEDMVFFALEEIFSQLNCSWFVRKPVRELLFEGYDDKLMKIAKTFMNLPYDKFGWFYKRNGTDDGEFSAFTGAIDLQKVDEVDTWNGERNVTSFDPPCNIIKGSAGDMWPPSKSHRDHVTLFVTDICRSLSFTYLATTDVNGITAHRYWTDDKQLDNGKYNKENKCFCPEGICLPAGGLNVSSCKFDAPAVVSYPHFLFADSVYSQGVIGMKPNPQEHRMYLDIVPEMGVPVGVAARMQINIVFEAVPNITQFENITKRIYFPILWFSETAEAGEDIVSQLKLVLTTIPLVTNIISFFMVSVGGFLILSAFVLAILFALGKISDQRRILSSLSLIGDKKVLTEKEVT
ncbi:protein croquemort-like isoform X2 [Argiope bruennichi]|uniref:protein croquemort-like isoform X2 n=1 Tax=Argiope bruennichi TaxID=94029 RepID=UPI0024943E13|nr:protein croquemort-like isoform X2 [Argiope bruennichi]